ncbi:MAG: VOC family protein [Acidimicrobiia bacterium]
MIPNVDFDHVAVANHSRAVLDDRYAGFFGGTFVSSGRTAGLYASIVKFANGVKVETIEPHDVEHDDFLERFLKRSGPGFHHLTLVLSDRNVQGAADATEAAGYRLMGSRTTFLNEVFVHPKDAHGIVVQYIEPRDYSFSKEPADFPRNDRRADLTHIALVVQSLDRARAFFVDLLGAQEIPVCSDDRSDLPGRCLDISWNNPGTVRLVEPPVGDVLHTWLGDRPGAVHHFAITLDDPGALPGARHRLDGSGVWEVAPEDNWGVRLLLRQR